MSLHCGITGTHLGATNAQKDVLRQLLTAHRSIFSTFHEGDCIGVDVEAALIAREAGYKIHSHPPLKTYRRGYFPADVEEAPKPYLVRDKAIVQATQLLFVVPQDYVEVIRSGTWATKRYGMAKKAKHPEYRVIIIFPNGSTTEPLYASKEDRR